jgi:hypothetical protein
MRVANGVVDVCIKTTPQHIILLSIPSPIILKQIYFTFLIHTLSASLSFLSIEKSTLPWLRSRIWIVKAAHNT